MNARPRWRRAALVVAVAVFAVLWLGGVAGQVFARDDGDQGLFASLFLFLSGMIVLLGAPTRREVIALCAVAGTGFAVEAAGVRFGVPFGDYVYTGVLRPQLFGVPVVMGFAWMALVAFSTDFAGRLGLRTWAAVLFAALWTTAIDLVIDPLAANHFRYWTWAHEGVYYGIPLTNFVGWFVTALLACLIARPARRMNRWPGFVGTAILLFFALVALANSLLPVALVGFALCAARLIAAWKLRPTEATR